MKRRKKLVFKDETQEIYIKLEQYDDIFSDFDMRDYDKRALSTDFLEEIKRASEDKMAEGVELVLHAPERERNEKEEETIKERLNTHFKRHYQIILKEKRKILGLGWMMVILGVISMILATLVLADDPSGSFWKAFLVIFLEPAAWFLLWEGMDQIIFNSKEINPHLEFYQKMSHAKARVSFQSY